MATVHRRDAARHRHRPRADAGARSSASSASSARASASFTNAPEFFRAWLPAFIFWFLIAAGALGVLMLQYVTGGEWGVLIRRPLGAAARTMPLFILFGLPIAFGLKHIYVWANHDIVAHDHAAAAEAAAGSIRRAGSSAR